MSATDISPEDHRKADAISLAIIRENDRSRNDQLDSSEAMKAAVQFVFGGEANEILRLAALVDSLAGCVLYAIRLGEENGARPPADWSRSLLALYVHYLEQTFARPDY